MYAYWWTNSISARIMISYKTLFYLVSKKQQTRGTLVQISVILYYIVILCLHFQTFTPTVHILILDEPQLNNYRNQFYGSHIGFLFIKECQDAQFYCRNKFLSHKKHFMGILLQTFDYIELHDSCWLPFLKSAAKTSQIDKYLLTLCVI